MSCQHDTRLLARAQLEQQVDELLNQFGEARATPGNPPEVLGEDEDVAASAAAPTMEAGRVESTVRTRVPVVW